MNKKRVLFLASTFPRWQGDDVPDFVYRLSQIMAQRYEVHVIAPWYPGAKVSETMEAVQVHRFRYSPSRFNLAYGGGVASNLKTNPLKALLIPFFVLSQLMLALRLLKSRDFYLIHAHWVIPQALVAWLACVFMGWDSKERTICTCHGTDVLGFNTGFLKRIKTSLFQKMGAITVVSEGLKRVVKEAIGEADSIGVIPMGTDFSATFYPRDDVPRSPEDSVFAGRMVEQKGVLLLLKCFIAIADKYPTAKLHMVGDGPLLPKAKALVDSAGLNHRVIFYGFCSATDLAEIYNRCAFAVFPALRMEGFGLTTVEAMGCECIVLASSFASSRELIVEGESGFLVPAGDMAALTEKWTQLLKGDRSIGAVAKRARINVSNRFGWENSQRKFENLYLEMEKRQGANVS